ncbi:MAG: RimK family alpha-L-glutamate ligase, partial [Gammaproteobacteria bacterium]|nr:RimK family alpha-L-glutamate ligase [Gammaproteobacteria bacterium]
PGGTLEEIVLYLDVLHGLRELGIPVHNDARGIERAVDKGMTSFLLHRAGVPTPPTWVARDPDAARALVESERRAGHALVLKPLFGSQGNGIIRVAAAHEVPEPEHYQNVYYLQRYIPSAGAGWHDWRVFVVAGRAIATMRREGKTWINNVATGATCYAAVPDGAMCQLAEDAVQALALHYAGVDLIRDPSGKLWVVEVNSVPAWKGLQSVCDTDIAEHVAGILMSNIESLPARAAV